MMSDTGKEESVNLLKDVRSSTHESEERRLLYDNDEHDLTNEDAVSLFNSSLTKALESQKDIIVQSITEQLGKSQVAIGGTKGIVSETTPYEFKHEGHKI